MSTTLSSPDLNRRGFLVGGAALMLAASIPMGSRVVRAATSTFAPNAFIRVGQDGKIVLIMRDVEMGQGIWTGASMLLAEELDVGLDQVTPDFAPPNDKLYANPLIGFQATGGSTSIRGDWEDLRKAAAIARAVLVEAAAKQWTVDPAGCVVTRGIVTHTASGRTANYASLVPLALTLPLPSDAPLKNRKDWTLIGTPQKRIDTATKVNGKTIYGIDARIPGMKIATVAMCPVMGGKLAKVDDAPARKIPGVIDILKLDNGVAVVGDHFWAAKQGLDALDIAWDLGPNADLTGLSREDAVATKAYLFALPPVHAPARPNQLSFPFNQRWALAFWNLAFLDEHRFRPDPALAPDQNRGAYLATALGHCGECHTPRNFGFAMGVGRQFVGAVLQGWQAYNITADRNYGIGDWSDQQITDYLNLGHAAGRGSASGPMGEAVSNSLQYLTPEDAMALVSYLRHVEPQTGEPGSQIDPAPAAMTASSAWKPGLQDAGNELGRRIFEGVCASCHEWNGAGRQTNYAALAGSHAVNDPEGINLVQVLLSGADLRTSHGTGYMPSFGGAYSDTELAAVSNYVISHFGGKVGRVTAETVQKQRTEQ